MPPDYVFFRLALSWGARGSKNEVEVPGRPRHTALGRAVQECSSENKTEIREECESLTRFTDLDGGSVGFSAV